MKNTENNKNNASMQESIKKISIPVSYKEINKKKNYNESLKKRAIATFFDCPVTPDK